MPRLLCASAWSGRSASAARNESAAAREIALRAATGCQVVMRVEEVGLQRNRPPVRDRRVAILLAVTSGGPPAGNARGGFGSSSAQLRDKARALPPACPCDLQGGARLSSACDVIRLTRDGVSVRRDGLVQLALRLEQGAEIVVRTRVIRPQCESASRRHAAASSAGPAPPAHRREGSAPPRNPAWRPPRHAAAPPRAAGRPVPARPMHSCN